MKNLLPLFLALLCCQFAFSQGTYTEAQRKKDKAKLDSICRKSPNSCIYYNDVIGVKSIFKNFSPRRIIHTTKICFDKKFEFSVTRNGKITLGCYYINTRDGYVAQFMNQQNESCRGMNNPQPGFDMMITSKVGESFIFRINLRGEKTFMAQMPIEDVPYGGSTNFVLNNPRVLALPYREPFTNQNLPTLPYYIEGSNSSSVKYLFGAYHAQRIPLKDYFGAFGTGYYSDSMGNTFICLAVESTNNFVKIIKISDVNECFDGSEFKDEIAINTYINNQILEEKDKDLQNQASSGTNMNCAAANILIQHKRQVISKEVEYNKYIQNGGNPQSKEGLKLGAMAQDVTDKVIEHRLETEKNICDQEYTVQSSSDAKLKDRAQRKIQCYSLAVNQLNVLKTSLDQVSTRNGNNYGKALGEKSMMYIKKMAEINMDCNLDKAGNIKKNVMDEGSQKLRDQLQKILKRD